MEVRPLPQQPTQPSRQISLRALMASPDTSTFTKLSNALRALLSNGMSQAGIVKLLNEDALLSDMLKPHFNQSVEDLASQMIRVLLVNGHHQNVREIQEIIQLAKPHISSIFISKETLSQILVHSPDYELPLLLIRSQFFDYIEVREGIEIGHSLGLLECIMCIAQSG